MTNVNQADTGMAPIAEVSLYRSSLGSKHQLTGVVASFSNARSRHALFSKLSRFEISSCCSASLSVTRVLTLPGSWKRLVEPWKATSSSLLCPDSADIGVNAAVALVLC